MKKLKLILNSLLWFCVILRWIFQSLSEVLGACVGWIEDFEEYKEEKK